MNKKSFIVKSLAFVFGTALFAACTTVDNPAILPGGEGGGGEPVVEGSVPVDLTAKVATDAWGGGWCATQYAPAVVTADGRTSQLMENYQGDVNATGTLLQQTIEGLENGIYNVAVYANAFYTDGRGFDSDMTDGATDVAYVFANDVKTYIVANIATATTQNGEYLIENVEVTDGKITIGLGKDKAGSNWHTIQIKALELMMPVSQAYAEVLPQAQELASKKMAASINAALAAAIAAPKSLDNYLSLLEAMNQARGSIVSYEVIDNGAIADDKLDNWTCTNDKAFHINTWSVEGNEGNDPSGMVTPFIENWVWGGDGSLLNAQTEVSYKLNGVEPGESYTISALIRAYSEAGNDVDGASFFVGSEKVSLSTGNAFEYNGMKGIYGTYSATGQVDAEGNLKFGVVLDNPTFNWIAIKSVKISK